MWSFAVFFFFLQPLPCPHIIWSMPITRWPKLGFEGNRFSKVLIWPNLSPHPYTHTHTHTLSLSLSYIFFFKLCNGLPKGAKFTSLFDWNFSLLYIAWVFPGALLISHWDWALDNKETVNRGQESKFGITNFYVTLRKGEVDFFF